MMADRKKREQRRSLYVALVDFVKVFDAVNCNLLFIILSKLVCPPKVIRISKKLYTDVNTRLIVDGELTQSLQYNSGVKQVCKLAQTLRHFLCSFAAYIKNSCSVQVRFHCDGDLFVIRRLKAKSKVLAEFIRAAQYADDIAIFSDSPEGVTSLDVLQQRGKEDGSAH